MPPAASSRSSTSTSRASRRRSSSAAARPAGPPPRTTTVISSLVEQRGQLGAAEESLAAAHVGARAASQPVEVNGGERAVERVASSPRVTRSQKQTIRP